MASPRPYRADRLAFVERAGEEPASDFGEADMTKYVARPNHRCPTCNSRDPHLHPAVAFEGETEICVDDFHMIRTAQNRPEYILAVIDKRASIAAKEPLA
jgi:hypothetical protein